MNTLNFLVARSSFVKVTSDDKVTFDNVGKDLFEAEIFVSKSRRRYNFVILWSLVHGVRALLPPLSTTLP